MLCVAGENRLTGQSRDAAIMALAQVGHPDYEVPLGPTIPAYYGLVASRYMHEYGVTEEDLAEFAVLMRKHALTHPGAQFHEPISVADVMASKPVALAAETAGLLSGLGRRRRLHHQPRADRTTARVRIRGCAQAHTHQHVTAAPALERARRRDRNRQGEGRTRASRYPTCATPRSMTASPLRSRCCWKTSALPGAARRRRAFAAGHFNRDGAMPLNTHGGLLSYGHCGVGGAMAHLVETHLQMTGRAGNRQVRDASLALLHGDGGVLSSHVSMFLERAR